MQRRLAEARASARAELLDPRLDDGAVDDARGIVAARQARDERLESLQARRVAAARSSAIGSAWSSTRRSSAG